MKKHDNPQQRTTPSARGDQNDQRRMSPGQSHDTQKSSASKEQSSDRDHNRGSGNTGHGTRHDR